MAPRTLPLDGRSLTLADVASVARSDVQPSLDPDARGRIADSAALIQRLVDSPEPVYGVNTGFGIFASRRIDRADLAELSRNLILSHAVGSGEPFPEDVVRAAMLIRANTLALGVSGVRPELVEILLEMLARRVTPQIPSQGSLGSSGDLAPLAHLALVMTADTDSPRAGRAAYAGSEFSGAEAMRRAGITAVRLGPKEGLALTNGATFAAALLSLGCVDAKSALETAETAAALSAEALMARSSAWSAALHATRPHPGQARVASRLRSLTRGSSLVDAGEAIQDAYSLRCIPQVVGPAWDILAFCEDVAQREINSATDNPLLLDGSPVSGGNFHGEPVGLAADYLKIALAEVGALAERRVFRLLASHTNAGLPGMLVADPQAAGLQSGFMMLQYTAASLVLENQILAAPASVLSLPTSADQEDHNANATTAGRHLARVLANLRRILAIELLAAAQALDLRLRSRPGSRAGEGTSAVQALVRSAAPFIESDDVYTPFLERLEGLIVQASFGRIGAEAQRPTLG